jgi:hypothetical protein
LKKDNLPWGLFDAEVVFWVDGDRDFNSVTDNRKGVVCAWA